ncbi:CopG family ribbon-helix-helix protein [Fundidesulfovibrio soli]|uniref:CopG family ribbon-helix-helix protein n=1 Tax=Fundidesulfovibrio soli TaxID=2922716 RepID=UPI001FAE94E3|nr:ribbon-helix-helix protein, CopG family [Fundidesulfovibrio soli]
MSVASTLRTDSATLARLDEVAKQMGRSRNWALNKAIEDFITYHEWYLAKVREGVEAAEAGRFASQDEVDSVFREFGA